jgi:hypothetical protein
MRGTILGWALLAVCATPAAATGQFKPVDAAAKAIAIAGEPANYENGFSDGRTELKATARCSPTVPRQIDVDLRWDVKRADVTAYRVDVTDQWDGFAKGRFLTSGERAVDVKTLPFEDTMPGIYYYWRVLAKTEAGWSVAGTGRYDAPVCAVDDVDGEK